jgi:hypothetical protein
MGCLLHNGHTDKPTKHTYKEKKSSGECHVELRKTSARFIITAKKKRNT